MGLIQDVPVEMPEMMDRGFVVTKLDALINLTLIHI